MKLWFLFMSRIIWIQFYLRLKILSFKENNHETTLLLNVMLPQEAIDGHGDGYEFIRWLKFRREKQKGKSMTNWRETQFIGIGLHEQILLYISSHYLKWRKKWQPTAVFLPGESQGQRSLVGCRLCSHRVRNDWSDLAAAYILFNILFHYDLSQDIGYSSLCYTVGPYCFQRFLILQASRSKSHQAYIGNGSWQIERTFSNNCQHFLLEVC